MNASRRGAQKLVLTVGLHRLDARRKPHVGGTWADFSCSPLILVLRLERSTVTKVLPPRMVWERSKGGRWRGCVLSLLETNDYGGSDLEFG